MSKTAYILQNASDTINQRGVERDVEQERSMAKIVKAFNLMYDKDLTETQGWGFMVLLKQVRAQKGGYREDDYVDLAAYAALQAESAEAENNLKTNAVTYVEPVAPIVTTETPVPTGDTFPKSTQTTDQQSTEALGYYVTQDT